MNNLDKDRWKNRRRMAWSAFLGGLLYPLLIILSHDPIGLIQLSTPFYTFIGIVVGAYIGFATVDDKWQK